MMRLLLASLIALASCVLEHAEALPAGRAAAPTVSLTTGTYQGFTNNSIDWYLGVPYAVPPTGSLRFKKAVAATYKSGTQSATQWSDVCPQTPQTSNYGTTAFPPVSENCLTLNVMRPAGIPYTTKLPVLVWIYGGGFSNGAASQYDPTPIIQQSVSMGKPIMFASFNYRLNAFGFLYNPYVTTADDANVGLTDQTLALEYLNQNLAAWGGDPTQVTIWGESAGGFSSEAQTIYAPSGLFRASITDSGYIIEGAQYPDATASSFWALANATNCGTVTTTSAQAAYICLQNLPFATLLNVSQALANSYAATWGPAITGSFLNASPKTRLAAGQYNKVPNIMGTNHDEGSFFGGASVNSTATLAALLSSFPNSNTAIGNTLAQDYLNDPADKGLTIAQIGWAAAGDMTFLADRRYVSSAFEKTQAVYTYLFSQPPPGEVGELFGAYHSSELHFLFGIWPSDGTPSNPAAFTLLQQQMIGYWVSFVHDLNPNSASKYPTWPLYATGQDIQFVAGNTSAISDSFRTQETTIIANIEAVN